MRVRGYQRSVNGIIKPRMAVIKENWLFIIGVYTYLQKIEIPGAEPWSAGECQSV